MIANILIDDFNNKIEEYFNSNDWEGKYRGKIKQINHDEPWLTLIACYSIFGNLNKLEKKNIDALNAVLKSSGIKSIINFTSITKVKVEERLPEIIDYRNYLRKLLQEDNFHLYPDAREKIKTKLIQREASFEGNTNLDLLIEGVANGKNTTLFVEAKFLSDISYKITYNPVRDQIIRNIDCGIDYVINQKYAKNFDDFYFLLLTPKVFRTEVFGGSKKSELQKFGADSSRLYCYKMNEYKNFEVLKKLLPHRNLSDKDWKTLSDNIGWITFEDFLLVSKKYEIINDSCEKKEIDKFFTERNLVQNRR